MRAKKFSKSVLAVVSAVALGAPMVVGSLNVAALQAASKVQVTTIDFSEPYDLSAGMGADQSLDITALKNVNFKVSKNQKVTLTLDFLKDYSGSSKDKSITVIFKNSKGNIVSQVVKSSDQSKEFSFTTEGTYNLSIKNEMSKGLWYRFTLS